jgi:two-component system response regulator YesN
MYKLFIVDDEQLVVETLSTIVDWEYYGVQIIGTALNGRLALNRILETAPDIVITDIRMPGLSGLDLIRALRENECHAECIIVSGYSEFEYAKEAIALEAVDYLIKPVELEEVAKTVNRAIERLERNRGKLAGREEFRLTEAFDRAVFTDIVINGNRASFDLTPFERFSQFTVMVIGSMDGNGLEHMKANGITESLLKFFTGRGITVDLLYGQQKVILVCMDVGGNPERLTDSMIAAVSLFEDLSLAYGIGPAFSDMTDCHASYLLAEKACQTALFFERSMMNANEWNPLARNFESFLQEWGEKIAAVTYFEPREFDGLLAQFSSVSLAAAADPQTLKKAAELWVNRMIELVEADYGIRLENVVGDRVALMERLQNAVRWMELEKECHEILKSVLFFLNVTKTTLKEKLVQEIRDFIVEHYHENVSLDQMAEHFELSPSYISNLYSKTTGQTIQEYTTSLRMQKSKKLLRESSLKISKISVAVGYDNQRYFCHVFKKHVGLSPGEYREKHMINK